ncbi:45265_t:CDS:2, partial [Gigaspora margarita]
MPQKNLKVLKVFLIKYRVSPQIKPNLGQNRSWMHLRTIIKFFWHNLGQWNSGLKSTEQFFNLSENIKYIKRYKKEEDLHIHFCDHIKKLKLNDQFYEITTVNNKAELLDQIIIDNYYYVILEINLVDLPSNHTIKSWHAIKYLIPLNTYLRAKESLMSFLILILRVDEAFFKNSVEELLHYFCITKNNSYLKFVALFLEGAKPVKKDKLRDKKRQLDKERLQLIIKLYFDYILVCIQFLYREFLTKELSKEILAIPLITMQAT